MRWISQVRHVVAKDVRHTRWMLITYFVLLAVAAASVVTGRAFGPYSGPSSPSSTSKVMSMPDVFVLYLPMISVILGLVASASLLQTDSPTQANAFWASRPLSPYAVFSAKLAVVVTAIVALPLLGSAVVLLSLDTSGGTMTALLARTALAYGEWALAMMIVAALTDDIRGAVVALVTILVGTLIVGSSVGELLPSGSLALEPLAVTVIGVIGGVWIVARLYHTRDKRLGSWIAGATVVACLVIASFNIPTSLRGDRARTPSAGPPLAIEPVNAKTWGQSRQLAMRLRTSSSTPAADRLEFQADSVALRLLNGKEVHVAGTHERTIIQVMRPPVGQSVRWIIDGAGGGGGGGTDSYEFFTVEPPDLDSASIAGRVKSVVVAGTVTSYRSRVIGILPLRSGALLTRDGRRIAIYGFSHDATGADVWVQASALPRDRVDSELSITLRITGGLEFAIVNDARSEAMLLHSRSNSIGSGALVLPWIQISTWFTRLSTTSSGEAPVGLPLDDAWYAGAHLVVAEWSVVGSYRTRGEVALR